MTRAQQLRAARLRRQKARKENGLCIGCGKTPPRDGVLLCSECSNRQKGHARKAYSKRTPLLKALRICLQCKTAEPVRGLTLCGKCAEEMADRLQRRRTKRISEGLCRCGDAPLLGRRQCQSCLDKANDYRKRVAA